MSSDVTLVTSDDRILGELLRASRVGHTRVSDSEFAAMAARPTPPEGVAVVDLRGRQHLPASLVTLKRQHPGASVVIVISTMDPALMLEAMRAGVTECVAEPLTSENLSAAVARVANRLGPATPGNVFAFVGSRGGVGTTTVAVSVATELAQSGTDSTLLVDLHAAFGDATLFLGTDARFSLMDAVECANRLDSAFFNSLVAHQKGRPDVLASPMRTRMVPLDPAGIRRVVEFAMHTYRRTVLDMTLYDPASPEVLALATTIVVVTNQELSAVKNAGRIVTDLRSQFGKERVTVVVNRADRNAEISLKDVERAVGQPVVHVLVSDYREAIKALNTGVPLTLGASRKLAAGFRALARELGSSDVDADPSPAASRGSMFGRISGQRSALTAFGATK